MDQVLDFFKKLFDTSDWPPRWHCGNWTDFHGWLYIVSDLLIWSAYFAIPLVILKFISKRVDAKFVRIYFLFAAFILACGSTHLLDAITFWYPAYRLNALVRFFTGVISWVTVFSIIRILPAAMSLRSHAELEREITERKRVEEELNVSNAQLNIAQEIAKVGHWEWEVATGRVVWSRELYKMFDLDDTTQLSYEQYLTHIHPDDKTFFQRTIEQALAERRYPDLTHRIVTARGTEKIVYAKGEVIVDDAGKVLRMIGTAQDVTEQSAAQQQLVERTRELEDTNAELQKFAYVASHDLKEPLRKILTFSSLLEKDVHDKLSENGRVYMDKIVHSAERMQRLIDDILHFSSLRVSKTDYEPTDLAAVLAQVLSDMEVKIATTGTIIRADSLPMIEAVPSQMRQLLQNLLSNAIKFRKEDVAPIIDVRCRLLRADEALSTSTPDENKPATANGFALSWAREAFVRISIADNGIGFDESYAEKIFEIFQRLHTANKYEGTGIGLAICKKIVDNHHGVLRADSRPGEGTTFVITLPLSQKNFVS